jgi:hypothetical protein
MRWVKKVNIITWRRSPKPAPETSRIVAPQQTHQATIIQRARLAPSSLTASDVLHLQRTIGNRVVGRLSIQRQPAANQARDQQCNSEQQEQHFETLVVKHFSLPTIANSF